MSIPPSDHDDSDPLARLATGLEAAWRRLPPPAKVVAWGAALVLVAPALRRAADSLGVDPLELLRLVLRPD